MPIIFFGRSILGLFAIAAIRGLEAYPYGGWSHRPATALKIRWLFLFSVFRLFPHCWYVHMFGLMVCASSSHIRRTVLIRIIISQAMTDAAQPEFLRPSIMDSTAIKYQLAHQLGLFDHPEPLVSSTGKSTSAQSNKDKATTEGIDALLSVARDSNSQNSKGSSAAGTKCRNKLVSTPYLRKDRAKVLRDWFEANLDKPYPSPQMKRELQERSVSSPFHPVCARELPTGRPPNARTHTHTHTSNPTSRQF